MRSIKVSQLLGFLVALGLMACEKGIVNQKMSGPVFGTSYSIIYTGNVDFQLQVDSIYGVINAELSTYIPDSDISNWNDNEPVQLREHFIRVFDRSKEVYRQTQGAFDPTIGAVVNAWDFGPEGKLVGLDSLQIDGLMLSVGFDKLKRSGKTITKENPNTYLDFNAIAKGYAVDVVAEFLESKGVHDYLVEIGGEIRCMGTNQERKQPWRVGIDQPNFDGSQNILKAITLADGAMATSGTYRKFKVDAQGNRYAHIIDTDTGYPSRSEVLSVSVIAADCMTADALATAFQAMGVEAVTEFAKKYPEIKVFLIYGSDSATMETRSLNGFPEE